MWGLRRTQERGGSSPAVELRLRLYQDLLLLCNTKLSNKIQSSHSTEFGIQTHLGLNGIVASHQEQNAGPFATSSVR